MKSLSTDTYAIALIDTYFANKRAIDIATEENKEILARLEKLTSETTRSRRLSARVQ